MNNRGINSGASQGLWNPASSETKALAASPPKAIRLDTRDTGTGKSLRNLQEVTDEAQNPEQSRAGEHFWIPLLSELMKQEIKTQAIFSITKGL